MKRKNLRRGSASKNGASSNGKDTIVIDDDTYIDISSLIEQKGGSGRYKPAPSFLDIDDEYGFDMEVTEVGGRYAFTEFLKFDEEEEGQDQNSTPHPFSLFTNPKNVETQDALNTLQDEKGQPNIADLLEEGRHLNRKGAFSEAMECFYKVLKWDKKNTDAWNEMGVTLWNQGLQHQAQICYEHALKIQPMNPEIWINRGFVLTAQKKYEAAIESYKRSIDISPNNEYVWMCMGEAYEKLGNPEKARDSYINALKIDPDFEEAHFGIERMNTNNHNGKR